MYNNEKFRLMDEEIQNLVNNNEKYINSLVDKYPFFFSLFLDVIDHYLTHNMRDIILTTKHEIEDIELTVDDIARGDEYLTKTICMEIQKLTEENIEFIKIYEKKDTTYIHFTDIFKASVIYQIYTNDNLKEYINQKRIENSI